MVKTNKSISMELYNREIPLCVVCGENPARQGTKTCSTECSKEYQRIWQREYKKTEAWRAYQREYSHRPNAILKRREYQKMRYQRNKQNKLNKGGKTK
jgi:hypothetical protein